MALLTRLMLLSRTESLLLRASAKKITVWQRYCIAPISLQSTNIAQSWSAPDPYYQAREPEASLGGFVASSVMVLWSVFIPLAALALLGLRRSVPWLVAFIAEVVVLAFQEPAEYIPSARWYQQFVGRANAGLWHNRRSQEMVRHFTSL